MTASGASFTVSSLLTITSGATKSCSCPNEDEWCPPPTSDHYGHHYCDFPSYNGGVISYECYWYDETEYIQSCSDCGSTTKWTCSYGSLTYNGSSYGICTYNATC